MRKRRGRGAGKAGQDGGGRRSEGKGRDILLVRSF